jgi:signal transduction histidine kinase
MFRGKIKMKIWKKIFIYSIVLFIILFNGTSIIIIENIFSKNLRSTIVLHINEYKNLKNTIYLSSDLYNINTVELLKIMKSYIYNESSNIEIFDSNNNFILSTNNLEISSNMDRKELDFISFDECKFIIKKVDNKKIILISSILKMNKEDYKLIITNDISNIYEERNDNYKLFALLSCLVTIILGIGMYFISKGITYPIKELINISNEITKGDYSKRATENINDEIGMLSINFNTMIDEIEDKIKELNLMNEQKQRFIDNLTHEIKTPITSIMGYSELLLKVNVNEEIKLKALNYINSQSKRLENLSNSLLKLIMIRNNTIQTTSIKSLILEAISTLEYKIYDKSINLNQNIKETFIIGDKDLIVLLFTNILDNAIKASNYNSSLNINGNFINDNLYEIKIIDEGIGISKEDLKNVLEPFYMVDKSRGKNLGLGLSICKEICEVNNIIFNIDSEINKGTTVTLIFNVGAKEYETEI